MGKILLWRPLHYDVAASASVRRGGKHCWCCGRVGNQINAAGYFQCNACEVGWYGGSRPADIKARPASLSDLR